MPGKLCTGAATNNAGAGNLRNSKAYCEGIDYRFSGTAVAKPITDNPHVAGSEAADSWDLGWVSIDVDSGGVSSLLPNCCAINYSKTIPA